MKFLPFLAILLLPCLSGFACGKCREKMKDDMRCYRKQLQLFDYHSKYKDPFEVYTFYYMKGIILGLEIGKGIIEECDKVEKSTQPLSQQSKP